MESKAAPTAPAAPAAASGAATTAASASGRPPTSTTSSAEAREAEIVRIKSISAAMAARLSKSERELDNERAEAARMRAELEAFRLEAGRRVEPPAQTAPRASSATGTARSRAASPAPPAPAEAPGASPTAGPSPTASDVLRGTVSPGSPSGGGGGGTFGLGSTIRTIAALTEERRRGAASPSSFQSRVLDCSGVRDLIRAFRGAAGFKSL